jgi:DNA-binding SARP family transcriptional activator
MAERLEILTLGGLRILVDGAPVRGLASRKAEALLVFLACQGGSPSRESLATLLWDDRTSSGSLANLSVLLSSLRKDLAPYLRIDRETVSLDPGSPWSCDATDFERQVALPAAVDVDLSQAEADRIERALELYRGPFLEGFFVREARGFEEWGAVQRERLRMQAVEGLRALSAGGLHRRQYRRGLQHVQRLLSLDPLSEAGHRTAMLLYARQGEMALGLAQYQACRDLLQAELGVDPSFETTDLYYRLRTAAENRVRNLPAPPTGLVGRGEELEKLGAQLIDPGCRLLTLVGPGGIGKTRLAIEAAARAEADFLHGVCFVALGAVERPDQLVPAVAGALQMTFRPGSEMRDQLIGSLRDRELLLVLDNLEHLVEAASLLGELLAAAPAVQLIATSRTPLRMLGERVLEVQGLPYSEAGDAAGKTSAAEELFVQSAVRARSGFTLAEGDLAWVRKICRRVDGLPLALEMAGAWTSAYGVREVAEQVERSLDFLGGA